MSRLEDLHTSAASILKALDQPNPNRDDHTIILGDVARKAIDQVNQTVYALLLEHQTPERAKELAKMFSEGRWTHDYPIDFEQAREMGLPVSSQMPEEVYQLMELYPQSRQQRPGVEFVPIPYRSPATPGKGER